MSCIIATIAQKFNSGCSRSKSKEENMKQKKRRQNMLIALKYYFSEVLRKPSENFPTGPWGDFYHIMSNSLGITNIHLPCSSFLHHCSETSECGNTVQSSIHISLRGLIDVAQRCPFRLPSSSKGDMLVEEGMCNGGMVGDDRNHHPTSGSASTNLR